MFQRTTKSTECMGAPLAYPYDNRTTQFYLLMGICCLLLITAVGCTTTGTNTSEPNAAEAAPVETATIVPTATPIPTHYLAPSTLIGNSDQIFSQSNDIVSLSQSTIEWETYAYELDDDYTILPGSFNGESTMTHTFDTWIMENEFLKVTILPDFGGRILSIIYKPTGHEMLYQNPIGVPYLIDRGVFYYDWLMIYGGIFPTFPEPEHGKTWLLPWDFEIVEESADEVTIMMSFTDDIDIAAAPRMYTVGKSGLEVKFYVTLRAGRTAVDTRIEITNTTGSDTEYEYWTNVSLAPGSKPGDPAATEDAIIVAPFDEIHVPSWYDHIAKDEKQTGSNGIYDFNALREYKNWSDEGIAYAHPNLGDTTFWGVINQENHEGMFRISDNSLTQGLKIWTFGYPQSTSINPFRDDDYDRPMIELWAGITPEFWMRDTFPGNETLVIEETYAPSIGMWFVTHANENLLVNMAIREGEIWAEMFSMWPGSHVTVEILNDAEVVLSSTELRPTTRRPERFRIEMPDDASEIRFSNEAGTTLMSNEIVAIEE